MSVLLLAGVAIPLRAAEHVTLRNGFDLICDHRQAAGDHVRLYMTATGPNFMEVSSADIASSEFVALPAPKDTPPASATATSAPPPTPA
ncbi:MAG TPA: lytic transglycosylase domain-containing protein, partial [Acidobacteriaceae bacterium]|nr:lytic transglycosylase domain-containing protein [Acidobacteriaceae bacterium]